MASQFSEDSKYFAQISVDGKLKIWNCMSNSFEQEFTPDYHLTTPFTCLHFWRPDVSNNKASPSPKKKKRKEGPVVPKLVLGTTSGIVIVYSIAKANIEYTINSNTNSQVNCLSIGENSLLYTGAEQNILEWHLKKKILKSHWKGGNDTITAILTLPDGENIVTASKNIKLWNIQTREVLKTFTGHSSEVTFLQYVRLLEAGMYILSGSKADRLLSCWNINQESRQKNSVCSYLMEDIVQGVSVHITPDGLTNIAVTVRSGVVHVYQHKLNGKCDKPLKPKTTLHVVSDTGQKSNFVSAIKIFGAIFRDRETLCIGHGSDVLLTFENVTISSYQKVQCLIRIDPRGIKTSKQEQLSKTKSTIVGDDVNYLTTNSTPLPIKRKSDVQTEIPMEQRLENLSLSKSDEASKVPRIDNVAQLLLQGLHSKDKNLLRTALCKKDENFIRNTVKRLPVNVFESLIKELSSLVHGKTLSSHYGALWLKHFAQIHAGVLISNPDLSELFSGVLGSIQSRISLQTPLNRLRGKLELLVPQISNTANGVENEEDEALLVFNDRDSSDSESEDEAMQIEIASDSDNEEWEESEQEGEMQENHTEASDSDSVVMVNDSYDVDDSD